MTWDEFVQLRRQRQHGKLLHHDFQKLILDFQLQEHEKFLKNFTDIFKEIDTGRHGILDEEQFRFLVKKMEMIYDPEEVNYLLG